MSASADLRLSEAAAMMREAMRDKSYAETSLGAHVAAFLRSKGKELTSRSFDDYELLGHQSIATTGDIYVDWDEAALAASLQIALEQERDG